MENGDELRVLGETIRTLRTQRVISQEALAVRSGLHRTHISLLERGLRNPSFTVVMRLAAGLGMTAADLVAAYEEEQARRATR